MLRFLVLLNLMLCPLVICNRKQAKESSESDADLGEDLVNSLRNEAIEDLSADEEYEDLRAEFLAYHTALESLTSGNRRSMKTTPCWQLGGVCIDHKMCVGRSLAEIPGCKTNLEVCCFTWNNFQVRDMRDKGFKVAAMPWTQKTEFGGKGIIPRHNPKHKHKKQQLKLKKKYHSKKGRHNRERRDDDSPVLVILQSKE